jgi:hypothetical protein
LVFSQKKISELPTFPRPRSFPIDPCLITPLSFAFSSKENTNSLNLRNNSQNEKDNVLKTNEEVKPWIHFDLGSVQKLKKVKFKMDVAINQQKSYFLFYSSKQPLDQSQSSVSYQSKSVTLNGTDYIELNDIEARYVKIQLNEEMPQSLVLNGVQFLAACPPSNPPEDGKCDNGGFERGDFTGWKVESGKVITSNGKSDVQISYEGVVPNRHEIITLPIKDSNISLSDPCSGKYIARIGAPGVAVSGAERITYSFTVDNTNSDFNFRFAFVLEDGHGDADAIQPFFEYRFYTLENGIKVTVPDGNRKIIAKSNDQFFEKKDKLLYKSWTCQKIDLSSYVGKIVYAEFTNADCTEGGHYAYSYVDGLCTTAKDNTPKADISGTNLVCSDPEYIFSGQSSCGANKYTWKLGKVHFKGFIEKEVSKDFFGQPGLINVFNLYQEFGFNFDFDNTYRLTLIVKNDCGYENTATKDFYISTRSSAKYKDIVVCNGWWGSVVMQPENNNCDGCSYQWTPSWKFVNPTSPFPTLKPEYLQCGTTVKVYATTEKGCTFTDDVKIYPLKANFIELNKDVDISTPRNQYCYYNIDTKLTTECIPTQYLKLRLTTDADPNYEKFGDLTSNVSNAYNYNFKIPQSLGENLINSSNRFKIDLMFDNNFVHTYGDYCLSTISTLENRYWYWGYFNSFNQYNKGFLPVNQVENGIYIPNIFSPSAANIDNKFLKAFTKVGYGFGAFWRKAEIYYRWGNLVKSIEEQANLPTIQLHNRFPDIPWKIWDGILPGTNPSDNQWYPSDTYTWYINLENCSISQRYEYVPQIWKGSVLLAN